MSSRMLMTFSRLNLWRKQGKNAFSTDFIEKVKNPNTFGTLSKQQALRKMEQLPEEEGDKEEVDFIDNIEGKTRLKPIQYAAIIKQYLNSKDLESAIDVLETRMLVKEKAKPDTYIYNLLISGCAKLGYTKKAFQLYNNMKKRAIRVKSSTYTSLFNACANSPFPKYGLEQALHLKDLMKQKGHQFNEANAHAMIKAFGRCHDINSAFSVVDEMKENNVEITSGTINFLLQACASNKESGFHHALIVKVWRKLIDLKIKPDLFTYNLMLRCARDCDVGDSSVFYSKLQEFLPDNQKNLLRLKSADTLAIGESSTTSSLAPFEENVKNVLNLISVQPQLNTIVYVDKIKKKWHKLILMGGINGFLKTMELSKVKPDIKTFTQLLFLLPGSREAENLIIQEMKKHKIKFDIDFFNMLIKKRNFEGQFPAGREVLDLISQENLTPNTITFGVLAIGCRNAMDAKILLKDLKESGIPINIEILGTLVRSGCESWNFKMISYMVNILNEKNIKPNNIFLRHINSFHYKIEEEIKKKNNGCNYHEKLNDKYFSKDYSKFVEMTTHLNSLEIEDPENMHPWHQFKRKSIKS